MPTARPDTYLPWMDDPGRSSQTEISGPVAAVATSPDSPQAEPANLVAWQPSRRSHYGVIITSTESRPERSRWAADVRVSSQINL